MPSVTSCRAATTSQPFLKKVRKGKTLFFCRIPKGMSSFFSLIHQPLKWLATIVRCLWHQASQKHFNSSNMLKEESRKRQEKTPDHPSC